MMAPINALHIKIEGLTASFRYPLTISGLPVSIPVPPYSSLLGMISACAGRVISPEETRIGFEFFCQSDSVDLERTIRLSNDKGNLKFHRKGQGISKRQVYWHPVMDLYVTNVGLKKSFENPVSTPLFGRSQDIAWILYVKEITLMPSHKGKLGSTLIPMATLKKKGVPGIVVTVPEWFNNTRMNNTRTPGPFGTYLAMNPKSEKKIDVEGINLFCPSDGSTDNVIYLHEWISGD